MILIHAWFYFFLPANARWKLPAAWENTDGSTNTSGPAAAPAPLPPRPLPWAPPERHT